MKKYEFTDLSISLPETVSSGSTYVFRFPEYGDKPPHLIINKIEELEENPDLTVRLEILLKTIAETEDNVKVGKISEGIKGDWKYAFVGLQFGNKDVHIEQKIMVISAGLESPAYVTIVAEDFSDNFKTTEPLFDKIIRSIELF